MSIEDAAAPKHEERSRPSSSTSDANSAPLESEQLYTSLFDHMLNGLAYCRMLYEGDRPVDFIYLSVNQAFGAQTGLQDVVDRRVSEVIPGIREVDPELFEIYGRVARGGPPETFETYVEALQMWFEISVYSPKPEHFVAVFDVITERKLADMALRSSEERFATVFQASPVGIVISKRETGEIIDANQSYLDIFGYQKDEVIGRTSTELHMFADPEERGRMTAIMARDGCLKHYEGVFQRKNGERGVFLVSIRPIEIGGQAFFLSLLSDYTEHRAAEDRLREAAAVFDSTIEGIIVTDAEAHITAVNTAFSRITGFEESEVIGRNPSVSKSERHDPGFYWEMWSSLLETGSWQGEFWNRRKNGEVYPVRMHINAVKDQDGRTLQYVGVFSDITSIKQYEERLEYLANHDPLTGLPNRLLLNDRIKQGIARAQRTDEQLAVLFIDLDLFKKINDSLGHPAGDQLLQAVATRLSACVRAKDTVARLGGDEFVVVLDDISDMTSVVSLAEMILFAIAAPLTIDNHPVYVSASIGISTFPNDGNDSVTLLANADAAMYKAKESGRNAFWFCDAELTQLARHQLNLESALRRALQEQEFVLHYQPQIEVATGAVVGVEALIRWNHPASGLIPPGEFIPFAEQTGLIVPLGEWILLAACRQLKAWLDEGIGSITVAVNISPRQFASRDILKQIRSALDTTGIPPQLLELEITEGAIMERGEHAADALKALKALGVRLSIDDFGTGYSSLAYLRRFPIDTLKIDQSFMRDIPHDESAIEITKTIIALGQNLHMQVLAEGVETEAQFRFLKSLGGNLSQGYLHSRPVAAAVLADFLANNR